MPARRRAFQRYFTSYFGVSVSNQITPNQTRRGNFVFSKMVPTKIENGNHMQEPRLEVPLGMIWALFHRWQCGHVHLNGFMIGPARLYPVPTSTKFVVENRVVLTT